MLSSVEINNIFFYSPTIYVGVLAILSFFNNKELPYFWISLEKAYESGDRLDWCPFGNVDSILI